MIPWESNGHDTKAKFDGWLLFVTRRKKGQWPWSVHKDYHLITQSGKIKTTVNKKGEGVSRCRKEAMNACRKIYYA